MNTCNGVVRLMKSISLAAILACGVPFLKAQGQSTQVNGNTPVTSGSSDISAVVPKRALTSPYSRHQSEPKRARMFYSNDWGVDSLNVKTVESGELIRFSYRVLDPFKAADLNDGKLEPALYGERSHVKLTIPSLEKVGQLRNKNTPEAGKSYWMAFSNKGAYVKKGDHVTVVIGKFQAKGLIVQ